MPTPVFCCGGECGTLTGGAGVGQHWIQMVSAAISTTTVRSGARSIQLTTAAGTAGARSTALASSARWVARAYVYFATLPSADTTILTTLETTGPGVRFKQSDSKLYAAVGTTFGASGVTVTTGQWYRVDCDFNINTGGSDTCDVRVDGTACGQATATGSSSATTTFMVIVLDTCTSDIFYDDIVLSHTAADYPIGAGYVNHFIPTSDGTHNVAGAGDFDRTLTGTDITNATTDAFELVNDVPLESGASVDWITLTAPPNATDYVECVFGPAPGISVPTTAPRAVEVIAGIHQAGTGVGNMEIRLNDKRAHFADPPSAESAWVIGGGGDGDFTDLRVRFGSPAAVDANPDQYFDCIMIEAEFAEVAASTARDYTYPQAVRRASYW
jgi:hypothetical protein